MSAYTIGDGPVSDYDLIQLLAAVVVAETGHAQRDMAKHDRRMLDGGCSACRALDLAADRTARRLMQLDADFLAHIVDTEGDA